MFDLFLSAMLYYLYHISTWLYDIDLMVQIEFDYSLDYSTF